jgi:hypothetical protein
VDWRADTLWTNVLLYIFLLVYDGNVSTPQGHDTFWCDTMLQVQPCVMWSVVAEAIPSINLRLPGNGFGLPAPFQGLPFIVCLICLGLGVPCCREANDTCFANLTRTPSPNPIMHNAYRRLITQIPNSPSLVPPQAPSSLPSSTTPNCTICTLTTHKAVIGLARRRMTLRQANPPLRPMTAMLTILNPTAAVVSFPLTVAQTVLGP